MILMLCTILPASFVQAVEEVVVERTADVVFVIDTTGSMGSYITSVRNNIENFLDTITKEEVNVRVRFVSYGDCTCAPSDKTSREWAKPSDVWYSSTDTDVANAKKVLSEPPFVPYNGGDAPETPLDGLGCMLQNDFFNNTDTRKTIAKYCILITDAGYKLDNGYGYTTDLVTGSAIGTPDAKGVVNDLIEKNIVTSVICPTGYFTDYAKFVTEPTVASGDDGGSLIDIREGFSIVFKKLAEKIVEDTTKKTEEVKRVIEEEKKAAEAATPDTGIVETVIANFQPRSAIKVRSNMIVLKKEDGAKYQYAEIPSGSAVQTTDKVIDLGSLSWSAQQDSCVMMGLQPSTSYAFKVTPPSDSKKDPYYYRLKTESTTGARFGEIPAVVYQGEIYNIKVNAQIKQMMSTSGSSITWKSSDESSVKVTSDDVGNGCQMQIISAPHNGNNKLQTITLTAEVSYTEKKKGVKYITKTKILKQKFKIENELDAIELDGQSITDGNNQFQHNIIVLRDKNKLDLSECVVTNQGEDTDIASRQNLAYYISDAYGAANSRGRKIAKVDSKGRLSGVNPGVTYITIAPKHLYNKYGKTYDFMLTIPVVCPELNEVNFLFWSDGIDTGADNVTKEQMKIDEITFTKDSSDNPTIKYVSDGKGGYTEIEDISDYVLNTTVGQKVNLTPYIQYNPTAIFNSSNIKKTWLSSDTGIVSVKNGVLTCKAEGYATITLTPVGGFKIDATTGKRATMKKSCSATVTVKVSHADYELDVEEE